MPEGFFFFNSRKAEGEQDKKTLRSIGQHVDLVAVFGPIFCGGGNLLHKVPLGSCLVTALGRLSPQPAATAGEAHGVLTQAG